MKFLTHPATVAWGLTTLLLLPLLHPLVSSPYGIVYHLQGRPAAVFLPVLIYLAMVWLLTTAALSQAQRRPWAERALWGALLAFSPWVMLKIASEVLSRPIPHRLGLLLFALCVASFLALLLLWRPSCQHAFQRTRDLAATMLGFAAISGTLLVVQLGWIFWQVRDLNAPLPMHVQLARSHPAHKRILWLILDELSYRQVYEHRFPGLQLPAFDSLAHQSTVFTHVIPAGLMTEFVIPSLMTGSRSDDMRASSDGRTLYLQEPTHDTWFRFDQHDTVFQDALDHGYSTAVAGWYNPYCRLLPQVLDRCAWKSHYAITAGMTASQSLGANLTAPIHEFATLALHYFHLKPLGPQNVLASTLARTEDYRELFRDADGMLDDESIDFLFLHMPVPHPSGIYNRHTGQFTTGPSTYIDNLALADAYLAHLRTHLEQRHAWDDTTLLITGDHSWRTVRLWSSDPSWSPEEAAASDGGKFDDRPGYILKLPQQQQSARIDTPFAALQTRPLLDALMEQRIQSPQDLVRWAAEHPGQN